MTTAPRDKTRAPYGSWTSPITAADLARGEHPVAGGRYVGDGIWWLELRPAEGGRYAIRRRGGAAAADAGDTAPVDVLPAPWNARTRVHEYGGGAWTVTGEGALIFAEFSDQRLYRLDPGATEPIPITPAPDEPSGLRYAELMIVDGGVEARGEDAEIWCVRESHRDGHVIRDLCAVPLDGSAATDASRVRSLVAGSDFLAQARLSPDGSQLAWIAWNHPQMPWDGTELRVAARRPDGAFGPARTLLGSTTESVLQPEWRDDETLYVISDRTGWWNLYRLTVGVTSPAVPGRRSQPDAAQPEALCPREQDFAGPMWALGSRWYAPLPGGRLLTVRTLGLDQLGVLDPDTGELADVEAGELDELATLSLCDLKGSSLGDLEGSRLGDVRTPKVLLGCAGARRARGLRELDLATGAVTDVRLSIDELPDAAYLPEARPMTFGGPRAGGADGGPREVHAFVYPPQNPDFAAPEGELPPYVAMVHGGPTAHVSPALDLGIAYFTSRGIGVVDVNYGGSTGYGREYRERLRGQWGIVDVEDVAAAVTGLAESGLADGSRLAIRGGSAGGWTVLSALTGADVFACGASYFGVAELVEFAAETHDFESRYLDGLIGPLPQARELYDTRAPVNKIDGLSCPVLLLQGLDDPIVPPSQAERFREALLAKGIPHAYIAYEGESHGFRKAETQISARESELSFYGQVMGFDPPGVPRLELWRPAQ